MVHPNVSKDERAGIKDQKRGNLATRNSNRRPGQRRLNLNELKKDFLDEAFKLFENNQHDAHDSFHKYEPILKPGSGDDILILFQQDMRHTWSEKKTKDFLHWFVMHHRNLLLVKVKQYKETPLIYAMSHGNNCFVKAVLEMSELGDVLQHTSEESYGTCLHKALETDSPSLEVMVQKCRDFPDLFGKQNAEKNTFLHLLVSSLGVEVSRRNLKKVLKGFVEKSPLAKAGDSEEGGLDDSDDSDYGDLDDESGSDDHDNLGEDDVSTQEGLEAPRVSDLNFRLQVMDQMMEEMVEQIVDPLNGVLYRKNKDGRTPYQERIHALETSETVKEVLDMVQRKDARNVERAWRKIVIEDPVAEYLRTYCIRKVNSRDDIIAALYQMGKERHIDFDLAGLPTSSISEGFFGRLANHIQFESVLRYVALPRLTIEPLKGSALDTRNGGRQPNQKGKPDLGFIFDWLRKNGVKRIIKVTVIDHGEHSHKDTAIEKALLGFQVEYWNWKKVDLCSEVIYNSTDIVQEVSLYWSGNNTVMMGWSSREGFGNRRKFKELKKINLFVGEGYEEQEVLDKWIDVFKTQLATVVQETKEKATEDKETQTEEKATEDKETEEKETEDNATEDKKTEDGASTTDNSLGISSMTDSGHHENGDRTEEIEVTKILDNRDFSYASEFKGNEGSQDEDPWITSMNNFATFLINIKPKDVEPIKIAIIDDGVDATLPELQRRIATGKSFSPYPNSTEFMNAYFVPSGKHGTLMARLICLICPKPQLYVARLEERLDAESGGRRITAKSAAEAVKWAIGCNVDIISMSWTIEGRIPDRRDLTELENAITEAAGMNILMFCSASDQGGSRQDLCYPGETKKCITIGGSSAFGDKLTWVNEDLVDFLLPGKNIPFLNSDKKTYSHETGSSLATACASGLAGTLLYCDRVLGNEHKLHTEGNMRTAFKGLTAGGSKFPDVQNQFELRFKNELRPNRPPSIRSLAWDNRTERALIAVMKRISE